MKCQSPGQLVVLLACSIPFVNQAHAQSIDFDRDIRPILNDHCAGCHGGVKKNGGFGVISRELMLSETDSGEPAVVPNDVDASTLIERISTDDIDLRMPPEGHDRLTKKQIDLMRQWVKKGATWPSHWSHLPLPPLRKDASFEGQHPIDWFVRRKLNEEKIQPSPPADAITLVRRLSLDLTGLLPAPDVVKPLNESPEAFTADSEALLTIIDNYLAVPQFGERWARHWLDEARYADSEGYEKDSVKNDAYRFRDWVINAINDDMPFDDFTRKQLAGDLLPEPTADDLIATKFHLQTQFNLEGGVDSEEDRTKRVIDRVGTLGAVWMGASIACCQCHDHPYDSFRQKDFFRLYAFFNNADYAADYLKGKPDDGDKKLADRQKRWDELTGLLEKQLTDKNYSDQTQSKLGQLRNYDNSAGLTRYLTERSESPRQTYMFTRGDFLRPMLDEGEVLPNTPGVFGTLDTSRERPTRLDLANWLVEPDNPLTARVTVNKVWMYLFGQPLADQPQEFGSRGSAPSHAELLDYLARWFVDEAGWSRKQLIRFIVTSQTYQQSSKTRPDIAVIDTRNRLLARQNRFRVEAEIVRDLSLQAAGLLSPKVGGPSVFPPLPAIVTQQTYAGSNKYKASTGEDRYRRGMYTFFRRTAIDPNLSTFDCPDSSLTKAMRDRSNNPLQALATLHNEVFHEAAQAFAKRLLHDDGTNVSDEDRLANAFLITMGRRPIAAELESLTQLLNKARQHFAAHEDDAKTLIGPHAAKEVSVADNAAWVAVTRVILNLDEFLTRS
ncbi:PSD1 and planctomycete cytochrome C domain-containing protein [Fuerstiella marisgermanici]|uniref:Planctomycete cytochrome C n=1 Tax=Fuerstiella marisgermanici TaxID=1891926 RepID=A0A1P8WMP3_9PLAN|nr:PSD1 and planctomycete cytochrome C domain-containing protein [Fuerstiella marisgermanici]APZ95335.1 Planctomycete cytochrome C [Fuerstiella marisgermanici]